MKIKVNETPIRTSRNFKINNVTIEAPEIKEPISEFKNVEISTVSSNYDEKISNTSLTFGIGKEQEKQINELANHKFHIETSKKEEIRITYTFDNENRYLINNLEFDLNKNANIIIEYRNNTDLECYHNGKIKINANKDSKINVTIINFLNTLSTNLESIENEIQDNANIQYSIIDIGGKYSISNYYSNLVGEKSKNNVKTIYLGVKEQVKDLNYIVEARGKNTSIKMDLQGALKDKSTKSFKGTIDFKKGSKKSKGSENESCMLLSDDARSIALPMLLCTEEDVDGEHSTSSGKADEKELFYIMSRGLSKNEAIKLIVKAKFYNLIEKISNEELKQEVINEIDRRLD